MTFFRRSPADDDIDEELRSHILHRADDLERSGLPRAEAERRARVEFGGQLRYREEVHDAVGGNALEMLLQDVRFSVRVLLKSRAFTCVSILTLALAIGANSVVFAALNAIILRPLDLPRAESLYSIHRVTQSAAQSYPDYVDMRDRNRSVEDLAAFNFVLAGIDSGENPVRSWLIAGSGNYFDVLGIQPYLGRFFHASDEHGPASAPYLVLSYGFWHTHFHDDPKVIGRVVRINKHPFTIIGVAPAGFHGTLLFFSGDGFVPLVNEEQIDGTDFLKRRGNRLLFMALGHLRAGVTPEQAAADFNAISADLERTYPNEHKHTPLVLKRPALYGDYVGGPARAFLSALMLLSGLILIAACANLGSLFAARAADRSREVALRLALGAGRIRVLRQLLVEALLISIAGGALGLWGAIVLVRGLATWQPFPQFPINIPVTPDAHVYVVAALLAVASGLLFGAVPVRQVLRTDPYEVVKSAARTTTARSTFRDVLVVAQIAICAVLVTASLVAVRGLLRSLHGEFGIEPRNVMLGQTVLDMAGYRQDAVPVLQKRMVDAMKTIPAVSAVGLIDTPPLATGGVNTASAYTDQTVDFRAGSAIASPVVFRISPGYLQAAGTRLLSGRNFTDHDDTAGTRVALVNDQFARTVFGSGAAALGAHFKTGDGRFEVVGVVENGKYTNLTEDYHPAVFLPLAQCPSSDTALVVRADAPAQQVAAAMRAKLKEIDPGLPAFIQSWDTGMDLVRFPARVATVALGILGLMGAMLSLTGVFGLAAYSVSRRMKEFGIRIALGAQRGELLRAALGRSARLLVFGSAAGVALGLLGTRVLAFIVYQATPRDPIVLAGVVGVMFLLGVVATWVPAQRALAIDPIALLREE